MKVAALCSSRPAVCVLLFFLLASWFFLGADSIALRTSRAEATNVCRSSSWICSSASSKRRASLGALLLSGRHSLLAREAGERRGATGENKVRRTRGWMWRRLGLGTEEERKELVDAKKETESSRRQCCKGLSREIDGASLATSVKSPLKVLPRSSSSLAVISIPVEVALHPAVQGALIHLTHLLHRLELLLVLTGSAAATALSLALALPRVILWRGKADLATLLPSAGLISLPFLILLAASLRRRGEWTT